MQYSRVVHNRNCCMIIEISLDTTRHVVVGVTESSLNCYRGVVREI